jgi:hypothetical protein
MNAQLHIQKLNATYLIPNDLRDGGAAHQRFDAAVRERLAGWCGQVLRQMLEGDDVSVWLIRQVQIDLAFDVSLIDDELIACTLAQRIAHAITRAISLGADGETILRFSSRAAYLARFISDLTDGRAWDLWYYNSFDSLRSLQNNMAIREALIREPSLIEEVLLNLFDGGHLERILNVLSESDVLRIYQTCLEEHHASVQGAGIRGSVDALLSLWPVVSARANALGTATAHNALRLYLSLLKKSPLLATDAGTHDAINHLLGFAEILSRIESPKVLLAYLAQGKLRAAIQLLQDKGFVNHLETLPLLIEMAAGDESWLTRAADILSPRARVNIAEDSQAQAQTLATPFGSLFMLLPSLLDQDFDELIERASYPLTKEIDKESALRFILMLKCLGRPRAGEALHDFAPSLIAGLESTPALEALQILSASATRATEQACMRMLLEKLVQHGVAECQCMVAEIATLATSGEEILLLRDVARDAWVYAVPVDTEKMNLEEALCEALDLVREVSQLPLECLLLGPGLNGRLDARALSERAQHLAWMSADPVPGTVSWRVSPSVEVEDAPRLWTYAQHSLKERTGKQLVQFLARAKSSEEELAYFSLYGLELPLVANLHFDLTWSLVAHAVLKDFAHRLVGFGWSSVHHLYLNFMEGTSNVRNHRGEIDVQLPQTPLQVILRMAGFDGQVYTVSWLNNTQVNLSLMQG